jgi:serine/threonine protein kinase
MHTTPTTPPADPKGIDLQKPSASPDAAAAGLGELTSTRFEGLRYSLVEPLRSGSMGTVYRGCEHPSQRDVAIKILHPHLASRPSVAAAFWREARAGRLIRHPNVVQIHDFGRDAASGRSFMVMELLQGRSLADVLREQRVPELDWTVQVMTQILSALAAAHDVGIVHRDIKPENVLVQGELDASGKRVDVIKLCDFGIARVPSSSESSPSHPSHPSHPSQRGQKDTTLEGTVCGTPEYMSPEQAQARSTDRMTDLYACGVMLYEMVTGRLPFEAESAIQIVLQQVHNRPRSPRKLRPDLDVELEAIILRAMAKDPRERFPSARAMRAALVQWLDEDENTKLAQQPTRQYRPVDASLLELPAAAWDTLDSSFGALAAFAQARARRPWVTVAVVLGSLALVVLAGAALAF